MTITMLPYIFVMAGVTYLIRMIPLTFITKKITNKYVLSFLYYIPYAVLSAMTALVLGSGNLIVTVVGLIFGIISAYLEKSLITVAMFACLGSILTYIILTFL